MQQQIKVISSFLTFKFFLQVTVWNHQIDDSPCSWWSVCRWWCSSHRSCASLWTSCRPPPTFRSSSSRASPLSPLRSSIFSWRIFGTFVPLRCVLLSPVRLRKRFGSRRSTGASASCSANFRRFQPDLLFMKVFFETNFYFDVITWLLKLLSKTRNWVKFTQVNH